MSDIVTLYAVLNIIKEIEVTVDGHKAILPLTWAEGMFGAIPVFETEEAAMAYAGDKYQIATIEAREP